MGIQKMKDSEPTPSLNKIPPAYYQQVVQDKDVVAVITNHPATENQMLAKLRTYGNWALTKQETIAQGDIRFSLYIFSLDGK
jgi:penicillin V acylase-like amidase (Ntn superfamily)